MNNGHLCYLRVASFAARRIWCVPDRDILWLDQEIVVDPRILLRGRLKPAPAMVRRAAKLIRGLTKLVASGPKLGTQRVAPKRRIQNSNRDSSSKLQTRKVSTWQFPLEEADSTYTIITGSMLLRPMASSRGGSGDSFCPAASLATRSKAGSLTAWHVL